MLVLLVEDHEDSREATTLFLTASGLRVESAVTGLQALAKASALQPDVIVMDLGLPGMDGWEATRRLKADPRTRDLPIIVLSAHAMPSAEQRAREAGCAGYIRKPCGPAEVLAAVRGVSSRRGTQ
jgi:two-component system cell cycle response regulator DivK